jgi:hypothetical protein
MALEALIRAALTKAGLPEDLHGQIKAENEDDIDGLVEEFKKTYKPPSIPTLAEMLKDETFKKELETYTADALKSEVDRRVTMALKTYDEKMKGKGSGTKEDDEKITALESKIDKLTEALTGQQEAQKKQGLKDKAAAALKEAGLPDNWIDRVNVEDETQIEGAVKALTEEMTSIRQGVIDKALKDNPIPGLSFGTPGQGTTQIDGFVKDLSAEDKSVAVEKIE